MLDGGTIERPQPRTAGSVNLAPVAPLQHLDEQSNYERSSLAQIIREFHNDITNRYLAPRREIAEIGRLNANVRSGKLVMKRDPMIGTLTLLPPLPGKSRIDRHVYPLAQVNSSQLTSIWTLSRPRMLPRHFGTNVRAQIQHALIEGLLEHYGSANFNEFFHQNQSLHMMDWGTSAIRSFYDDRLNTMYRLQPIIQNVDKTVFEGFGFCRECLHDNTPDKFAGKGGGMEQCPECGSYNLSDMQQPQMATVPQIVGAREVAQGDIACELIPIPALNWDQRVLVQDSSYVQLRSEAPKRLITSTLGVEVAEQSPESDEFLRILNMMGTRGGTVEGLGRENLEGNTNFSSGTVLMDEEWYKPEWYAGMKLDRDEQTVSGEIIPKDVPLEKIFPDALCVAGFNDMQVLTFVGNEKCRIKSGVYHIQSQSGIGKGTSDSIEISEQLNIAHTANLEVLKRFGAGGGHAYDREVMTRKEATALLKPGSVVGIKMRGTRYTQVDQAITQMVHQPQSQESLAAVAQLTNLLNICFQTTEFTAGVASDKIDINTLGGQQMLEAQNRQRSAAPLRMKAFMFSCVAEDILDLFREHIKVAKPFGTNDKFALTRVRYLSGKDIPDNIKCEAVPDSEMPTNILTQQQAATQMLEKSQYLGEGGFVAIAEMKPRMAVWWASLFPGVNIPLFNQTEILIVCQDRLDELKEHSEEVTQRLQVTGYFPPLPEAAQEVLSMLRNSVAEGEENHVIKAEVIKEYLDDEETKEWSPLMKVSVEALIQLHYTYDRNNRFRVPMLDQEGQMMMQQKAMLAAAPMIEEERDKAALEEGAGRVADEVQKDLDQGRNEEAADSAHERKIQEIKEQNAGRKQLGTSGSRK